MSGTLIERHPKDARAFCEGVHTGKTGGADTDNPHAAGTGEAVAWEEGWRMTQTVTAWVPGQQPNVGKLVTNGGELYSCRVPGTAAGSGGPSGRGEYIVDNTVVWRWQATGSDIDLTCCGYPNAGEADAKPTWNTDEV